MASIESAVKNVLFGPLASATINSSRYNAAPGPATGMGPILAQRLLSTASHPPRSPQPGSAAGDRLRKSKYTLAAQAKPANIAVQVVEYVNQLIADTFT